MAESDNANGKGKSGAGKKAAGGKPSSGGGSKTAASGAAKKGSTGNKASTGKTASAARAPAPQSAAKSGGAKSGGAKSGGAKAAPRDVANEALDAALELASDRAWSDVTLADIAQAADLKLSQLYPVYPTKAAILDAFARRIDAEVLEEGIDGLEDSPARDRLFDVMMRRFDALEPHREAVANILADALGEPGTALAGLPQLSRSMAWMLEAAQIPTEGWRGLLRVQGLVGIYLATLRVWLRDDSVDKSKTMAQLDSYLRRIEDMRERMGRPRRAPGEAAEV
jgi:AcrR family transcriptional regulator